MAVTDAKAITRDGWYFLVADESGASEGMDFDQVVRVSDETTRAAGGALSASHWIPTDRGWVGRLSWPADAADGVEWLEAFANLCGQGTEIRPRPRTRSPARNDIWPSPTLGVAHTTNDLARLSVEERGRTWAVPEHLTRELLRGASSWLDFDGAAFYYRLTPWSSPTVAIPPVQSLLDAANDRNSTLILRSMTSKPYRRRTIELEREGRVVCQEVDRSRTPEQQLASLLECLRWQPAAIDYAFITFQHGGSQNVWMGDYFHYYLPNDLVEPLVRGHRRALAQCVPDAFAVQVLTDAHLERAHDLSNWDIDEIADRRYLVSARDLSPWPGTPPPHPESEYQLGPPPTELIRQARDDFGDMIATPSLLQELDPF